MFSFGDTVVEVKQNAIRSFGIPMRRFPRVVSTSCQSCILLWWTSKCSWTHLLGWWWSSWGCWYGSDLCVVALTVTEMFTASTGSGWLDVARRAWKCPHRWSVLWACYGTNLGTRWWAGSGPRSSGDTFSSSLPRPFGYPSDGLPESWLVYLEFSSTVC